MFLSFWCPLLLNGITIGLNLLSLTLNNSLIIINTSHASSGGDNSSDTESAPSPSQADSSKSGDSKRADSAAGDAQCSDQDKGQASNGKSLELSYGELCVKEEKSPESETGSQEARAAYAGTVHPKTEPQDVDMKTGEVQVKMEPEIKERGEKEDHGGRELHSDNDSSATCSADEDVEAEPERRCVFMLCVHNQEFTRTDLRVLSVTCTFCAFAEYTWKSLHYSTLQARYWCPHPSKTNSTSSSSSSGQLPSHLWLVRVSC